MKHKPAKSMSVKVTKNPRGGDSYGTGLKNPEGKTVSSYMNANKTIKSPKAPKKLA